MGNLVQDGWRTISAELDLKLDIGGIPPLSHFSFTGPQKQAAHTLFTKRMLERGFLATKGFYATFAHTEEEIRDYLSSASEVFGEIRDELEQGTLRSRLTGPVAHTGFARLT
jgi:hypothetical protein